MKKAFIGIWFVTYSLTSIAQGFEMGTEWFYDFSTPGMTVKTGSTRIQITELVKEESATLYELNERIYRYDNHSGQSTDTTHFFKMRLENGIYYYDEANIWFDTNLKRGDTLTVNRHRFYEVADSLFDFVVDSTYLDSSNRRHWRMTLANDTVIFSYDIFYERLIYLNELHLHFIEGIGYVGDHSEFIPFKFWHGYHPWDQPSPFSGNKLKCVKNWNTDISYPAWADCYFLALNQRPKDVLPYVVPTADGLQFYSGDTKDDLTISVYSVMGAEILERRVSGTTLIPFEKHPQQIYLIKFETSNRLHYQKVFWKGR